eukprot:Nitzschia sp. Nitz4//scaffold6_size259037//51769//52275//NITZ4_001050-RA/size259037-processed-gene-0.185-mRNA-1//1//CDS//3329556821//1203//frame0
MEPVSEFRQSPRRKLKVGFADRIEVISHPSIRFDPSLFYSSEEISSMMEDAIRENETNPSLSDAVSAKGKNTLPLPESMEQLLDDSPEMATTTKPIPTNHTTNNRPGSEPPRVRESRSQREPRGERQQRPKRAAGALILSRTDMQRALGGTPSLAVERVRRSRPIRER